MNVLALERLFNRIQQGSLTRSATPATLFFSHCSSTATPPA
jgi:hypothetical protein